MDNQELILLITAFITLLGGGAVYMTLNNDNRKNNKTRKVRGGFLNTDEHELDKADESDYEHEDEDEDEDETDEDNNETDKENEDYYFGDTMDDIDTGDLKVIEKPKRKYERKPKNIKSNNKSNKKR
jgi:ABC-type antimicrobial peptide transport system permease subunit